MSLPAASRPSGPAPKHAHIASNPTPVPHKDLIESFEEGGDPPNAVIDEVDEDMSMASLLTALPKEDCTVHFRCIGNTQDGPPSETRM